MPRSDDSPIEPLGRPAEKAPGSALERTVAARLSEEGRIPPSRRRELALLAAEIAARDPLALLFVCTHNSRRSHLAAIWAAVAARRFGFPDARTFSAGTEATGFEPRAVAAVARAGFGVERVGDGGNPVYLVDAHDGAPPLRCFSKTLTDATCPRAGFVAVLTCAAADAACPVVPGAAARIALPYRDPKEADGTPAETETYDERCAQIAREMLHAFRRASELRRGRG